MRTIKFRGKRCFSGKWRIGNLLCEENMNHPFIKDWDGYKVRVDAGTIGQYTGLHDEDGNDIYEGDILLSKYTHPYSVCWDSCRLRFTLGNATNEQLDIQLVHKLGLRVIGNVHDNPTLIADMCSYKIIPDF
jgi:YopX protein